MFPFIENHPVRRRIQPALIAIALASSAPAALVHQYNFEDGSLNDSVGAADGTGFGSYGVSGGQLTFDTDGEYVDMGGPTIAINTFTALTIEVWATPSYLNTGYHAILGFGETNVTVASDYLRLMTNRGDSSSSADISLSDDSDPWTEEDSAYGAEDTDVPHHYVLTLSVTTIALYIDGVLSNSTALSVFNANGGNPFAGLSNTQAYIGKTGYVGDPTWFGSIDQINIHDSAFDGTEVLASFTAGPVVIPESSVALLGVLGGLGLLRRRR